MSLLTSLPDFIDNLEAAFDAAQAAGSTDEPMTNRSYAESIGPVVYNFVKEAVVNVTSVSGVTTGSGTSGPGTGGLS